MITEYKYLNIYIYIYIYIYIDVPSHVEHVLEGIDTDSQQIQFISPLLQVI
jgi:hypothetical protein